MEKYECKTHNVILLVEGNQRTFHNPPGAYAGMPHCQLHIMPQPAAGEFQDCRIVKEE